MKKINVVHSDGKKEPIDENKILSKISSLSDGLNIDPKEVFNNTKVHFYDGIKTSDINRTVAQYAQAMATVHNTDYDTLAARLYEDSLPKMKISNCEEYGYSERVADSLIDVMFAIHNTPELREKLDSIEEAILEFVRTTTAICKVTKM